MPHEIQCVGGVFRGMWDCENIYNSCPCPPYVVDVLCDSIIVISIMKVYNIPQLTASFLSVFFPKK